MQSSLIYLHWALSPSCLQNRRDLSGIVHRSGVQSGRAALDCGIGDSWKPILCEACLSQAMGHGQRREKTLHGCDCTLCWVQASGLNLRAFNFKRSKRAERLCYDRSDRGQLIRCRR